MSKPTGIPTSSGPTVPATPSPSSLRSRFVAIGLGALFVLCWSSGFIGAKLGSFDAAVPTVLMWRFVPLALILVPVLMSRRARSETSRATLGRQIAIGALSQSGYLLTVYAAVTLGVSTGTTALIDGVQPLVVAALLGPLLGAAVSGRQWIGLIIGLIGVVVVTWTDAVSPATDAPAWAYLVPFGGMLCLVAATFLERRSRTRMPPLRALAIHSATSAVVFTALAIGSGTVVPPASAMFWITTAWLIVLSTFGGYGLYWYLLGRIGVAQVNTLMFLVPPVTAVWGALMFGEPFTLTTAIGLAMALVATWIVTRSRSRSL